MQEEYNPQENIEDDMINIDEMMENERNEKQQNANDYEVETRVEEETRELLKDHMELIEDKIMASSEVQKEALEEMSNTLSKIEVLKGDVGDKGEKGDTGERGPKGDRGTPGTVMTPEDISNIVQNLKIEYKNVNGTPDLTNLLSRPTYSRIMELADANLSNITNGQTLVWNSSTGHFDAGTATGGSSVWGGITGTLSSQTDLSNALNLKADTTALTAGLLLKEDLSNKQTDLTASATNYPTVDAVNTGLALKEGTVTATTTADYYRGDKTFQTLNGLAVANTPTGNISSSTVQGALNELDTEKATDTLVVHLAGAESITGIKTFTAQPAGITGTSIVNTPAGTIASTNVQSAINELDVEKENITNKATDFTTLNNTLYPTTAAVDQLVSNAIAGLSIKTPVRMATTGNITLSGLQTLDGIVGVANDRVLVKNQTTQTENGIYLMQSGAWTRTTDADLGTELVNASVYVSFGTVHATQSFVQATPSPITIGVSNIVWNQNSSGSGSVTTASVTTANGFAGIVTNPTTTPAIAISTTVTGILKGNGTSVSAAVADTDYLLPGTTWNITGNAGTVAGTNFIGTTDDVDIVFKRNGVTAGHLDDANANASFGVGSLPLTATGSANVAIGQNALKDATTGSSNTVVGQNAGDVLTGGAFNTFIGEYSGPQNINGGYNTFVGAWTGSGIINGIQNTFIGAYSQVNGDVSNNVIIADGNADKSFWADGDRHVAIGIADTTPNTAAMLDIQGTEGGVLIPRLNTSEKLGLANVAGNVLYDTTLAKPQWNNGTIWNDFGSSSTVITQYNGGTSTGSSTAYAITVAAKSGALIAGDEFSYINHVISGTSPTININGLGAINMADSTGTNLVSTALPLNFNVSGFYNGTKFIVSNAPIVSAVVPGMSNTTMTTLGQSIAAGSTVKVTGWSVSPTYLQNVTFNGSDATINTTGWYTISATILWNTTASFGQGIRVMNSAGSVGYVQATYAAGSNTSYWYNSVSTTVYLTSGGTLAIWADNQAGTAKTIAPFAAGQVFSILKVA